MIIWGVFFKFHLKVGVEESIVIAPRVTITGQLFKTNLTFALFVFLRFYSANWRVVRSQSTLQRQIFDLYTDVPKKKHESIIPLFFGGF
jgi:hypothetical protein